MTAQERITEWAKLAESDAKLAPAPWNTIAVPAMAAALTAVLARHEWYCPGCEFSKPEECCPSCRHCYEPWPCPTVAAVETALEATT